jgi:hypothetical protein
LPAYVVHYLSFAHFSICLSRPGIPKQYIAVYGRPERSFKKALQYTNEHNGTPRKKNFAALAHVGPEAGRREQNRAKLRGKNLQRASLWRESLPACTHTPVQTALLTHKR